MKTLFLWLTFLLLAITSYSVQAIKFDGLVYTIQHGNADPRKQQKLTVTVSFTTKNQDFQFFLPSTWAGMIEYYDDILDLKALSNQTTIFDGPLPHIKKISHKANTPVIIQYSVSTKKNKDFHAYANRIESSFFHFFGYGVFGHPEMNQTEDVPITLHWKVGKDKKIINSFGKNSLIQNLKVSMQDLKHASYCGGDFGIYPILVKNKTVFLVSHKVSQKTIGQLKKSIKKIVGAHRKFWNDFNYPFYIVSAHHHDELYEYYIGTHVKNAIVLFFNEKSSHFFENLTYLIAHEHWHTWLGSGKLRQPERAMEDLWIYEGFTDYYAGITALRSGLVTLPQYIRYYNDKIEKYYHECMSNMTPMLYGKGHIMAQEVNLRLKKTGSFNTIDSILLDLYRLAEKSSLGYFNLTSEVWGLEMQKNQINLNEQNLAPSEGALGPCVSLTVNENHIPQYSLNEKQFRSHPQKCLAYFKLSIL